MSKRPLFPRPVAHRGLHDRASGIIENTASAFEAAITGDYAIECDVQLTSDDVAVVFHDDDAKRLLGKEGPVRSFHSTEFTRFPLLDSAVGDTPQTFDQFLAQIRGRALLQIEMKRQADDRATDVLAGLVAKALKSYTGPVTVESFDPRLLIAIRRHGYAGPLGIITYGYDKPDWDDTITNRDRFILRHLLHWPWTRFTFISCYQQSLDLPAVRFWRALGVPVTVWTIRSAQEARAVKGRYDQVVFEGFDPATI